MPEKFRNRYRIPSARLQSWNYSWNGAYFITICTQDKKHYFGEIADRRMQLSHIGILADILWYEIKSHAKNTELGEYIIMPNHVHGILILVDDDLNRSCRDRDRRDKACLVSTTTTWISPHFVRRNDTCRQQYLISNQNHYRNSQPESDAGYVILLVFLSSVRIKSTQQYFFLFLKGQSDILYQ